MLSKDPARRHRKADAYRSAGTLPAIPAPTMQTPGRRGDGLERGGSTDDNDSDRSPFEPDRLRDCSRSIA